MVGEPELVEQIRVCLAPLDAAEKKMFGGTCFLVGGNMVAGTLKGELVVRVGKDGHEAALAGGSGRTMDITGRQMLGFILVSKDGTATDAQLRSWIDRAVAYVRTLPPKPAARVRKNKRRTP